MSVEQENLIDAVGLVQATGTVVLTISDHLEWGKVTEHLLMLQRKINRYLAFVETGELFEKVPDAKGRGVRIALVCRHHPSSTGRAFLTRAESAITKAGLAFGWRVIAA